MNRNEQQMYSDITSIRKSLEKIANALDNNVTQTTKDIPGFEGTLDALDNLCNVNYRPEINPADLCNVSTKDEEYDFYKPHYKVLKKIDLKICNRLASQLSNKCKEAYLIKIGYNSGGTIGWLGGYYIFGIIEEDNNEYIVPLKFFNLKNLALNFLEKNE